MASFIEKICNAIQRVLMWCRGYLDLVSAYCFSRAIFPYGFLAGIANVSSVTVIPQEPHGGGPVSQIKATLFFPPNYEYSYNASPDIAMYIEGKFESLINPLLNILTGVSAPQYSILILLSGIASGCLLISVIAKILTLCCIVAGILLSRYQKRLASGRAFILNIHRIRQKFSNLRWKRRESISKSAR